jgi:uncharacterized FlaG/YvyC family protein
MSKEYQPENVKDDAQKRNNEQLKSIITEINREIEDLKNKINELKK